MDPDLVRRSKITNKILYCGCGRSVDRSRSGSRVVTCFVCKDFNRKGRAKAQWNKIKSNISPVKFTPPGDNSV